MTSPTKIICPGVSKTGTVSLTVALQKLGFDIKHYPHDPGTVNECVTKGIGPVSAMTRHDGVSDLPAAMAWRQLLDRWPDALIIYTYRSAGAWLKSMEAHYKKLHGHANPFDEHGALRVGMWGFCGFNESRLIEKYEEHYYQILDHSQIHSDRVLIMDICAGDGWEVLVPFLNDKLNLELAIPEEPFPHENKTRY